MSKLSFYQQKRRDGGLRTGIDLDDERVWERFEPGDAPQDPALLWFVDIRCTGGNLPAEPEPIRDWFLKRSEIIQPALRALADELVPGVDGDWPLKRTIPDRDGTQMAIYCSAIRGLTGREIPDILSTLATRWPVVLRDLEECGHPVPVHG